MVEQIGVKDGRGVLTPRVPDRSDEVEQVAQKVKGKCPHQLQGHDVTSLREVAASPITWALRGQTSSTLQKNCVGNGHTICQVTTQTQEVVPVPEAQANTRVEVSDAGYADTLWAGCFATRKSTSGGWDMKGKHCLKTWSETQATVGKSSAESELYGSIKASSEGLGRCTLMADLGLV